MNRLSLACTLGLTAVLFTGCSDGDERTARTSTTTTTAPVARAVADQWPVKWCQAKPAIPRTELYTLMGQPTEESTSYATATWKAYRYHFIAFFNVEDRVHQLYAVTRGLSAEERSRLRCDSVRPPEEEEES